MTGFTIYPAIDLRAGRVVRLRQGDPARMTSYSGDPAQSARRWMAAGAAWLHVVNLDGAFGESDSKNQAALRSILDIAKEFDGRVQFGGGIRSLDAIAKVLQLGVSRVVLGTLAIEQAGVVADGMIRFGREKFAVGIDARDGKVRVHGWGSDGGISAADLAIQMKALGAGTLIFTDISRDGLGSGLNLEAARALADTSGLDVIASGGVHTLKDVRAARAAGLRGVIVGRAIYEGTLDLKIALQEAAHAGEKNHPLP